MKSNVKISLIFHQSKKKLSASHLAGIGTKNKQKKNKILKLSHYSDVYYNIVMLPLLRTDTLLPSGKIFQKTLDLRTWPIIACGDISKIVGHLFFSC